jgi:hypothetical protein
MFWKKYRLHFLLLIIFFVVISINFNKPFGFFRESNAALVCINAGIWNNHSTIQQKGIPVNSFAFLAYNNPTEQLYNTTITFGSWWITTPYYFFNFFGLQPTEISIRLFSLLWLLLTIFSVVVLTKKLVSYYQYNSKLGHLVTILYLFTPAILWYNVQGYVHEIAVLPFYFLSWYFLLAYLQKQNIKWLWLLSITLFVSVQFDWLPCFQTITITLYLFFTKKLLQHKWAFIVPSIGLIIGIAYFLHNYIEWAGFDNYITYMKSKFAARTVGGGGLKLLPFLNHNFNLVVFYIMGLGITTLLFILALIKRKAINPFLLLMAVTALLHHIIFWGFSTEHDHAAIKMFYPIVFCVALLVNTLETKKQIIAVALVIVVNISQYFILHNYPIRKGIYTNAMYCLQTGKFIQQNSTDTAEMVFMNTDGKYYPQIEFYAGKYYVEVKNLDEAKAELIKRKLTNKGCYISTLSVGDFNIEKFER